MLVDKMNDYRQQFSRWWQSQHKAVIFPAEVRRGIQRKMLIWSGIYNKLSMILQGTVFDYYVDDKHVCMTHWSRRVPEFVYSSGGTNEFTAPCMLFWVFTALFSICKPMILTQTIFHRFLCPPSKQHASATCWIF